MSTLRPPCFRIHIPPIVGVRGECNRVSEEAWTFSASGEHFGSYKEGRAFLAVIIFKSLVVGFSW
jgi:hypothetical protein